MDASVASRAIQRHEQVQSNLLGRGVTFLQSLLPSWGTYVLDGNLRREFNIPTERTYGFFSATATQFLAGITMTFIKDPVERR